MNKATTPTSEPASSGRRAKAADAVNGEESEIGGDDAQRTMSGSNIEQNRLVGIDSPAKGSRMGREANKPSGDPGERGEEAEVPAKPHSTSR